MSDALGRRCSLGNVRYASDSDGTAAPPRSAVMGHLRPSAPQQNCRAQRWRSCRFPGALRLEKQPDKTLIGRIERGFAFLGCDFSPSGPTNLAAWPEVNPCGGPAAGCNLRALAGYHEPIWS
jgi:hypothetical protein